MGRDNRRTIHGRSRLKTRYDGLARWLQRFYVVRDLMLYDGEHRSGERIIETGFNLPHPPLPAQI